MGILFTKVQGNILTTLMGNVLTGVMGKVLDIYTAKSETKTININSASQEELISLLQISEPFAQKIIALREELGGFKDPQDITQLSEITNLE